jgi:hypothetical protein
MGAATDVGGNRLPELDQRRSEANERMVGSSWNPAEIKWVRSMMLDCKFGHVRVGGANVVAHTLAQRASRCHESVVMKAPVFCRKKRGNFCIYINSEKQCLWAGRSSRNERNNRGPNK